MKQNQKAALWSAVAGVVLVPAAFALGAPWGLHGLAAFGLGSVLAGGPGFAGVLWQLSHPPEDTA